MQADYINFISLEKYATRDNFLVYMNERYSYTEDELIEFWTKQKSKEYDKKHLRKSIRFSTDEYKIIEQKLSKLDTNFSTFAKAVLLNYEMKCKEEKKLLFEINELNNKVDKIGVNINQIAKALNEKRDIDSLSMLVEIEKKINEIKENGSKIL